MPKSKRAALETKRTNCTATGSLRPSSSRKRKRSSREVSCPTIWLMGSPTNLNSTKASSATVSMTMAASNSRRMVKASIGLLRRGLAPGQSARRPHLLHLCPVKQDLVVGPLHDVDLLGHAPGQRLLMQRQHAHLLVIDAERLGDHVVALGGVGLDQDLLPQLLDPLVTIATIVEEAAFAVGVPAANNVGNDIPAIERARGPAQEIEGGIVLVGLPRLLEELRLRHGIELYLDVDARQHLRHGLTDTFVVDVAIVGTIQRHLEAVGIAGLGEQLFRRGGLIGPALELAGPGKP